MAKTKPQKNNNKSNSKGSKRTAPNTVAMKKQKPQNTTPKENPFETIWSRRKFDVLGTKRQGEARRLGVARKVAIQKREKTLLKEYQQSGKASTFVDKRIGEQEEGFTEFDKAIMRSQRQRQRQMKTKRSDKYNLSDGEEEQLDGVGDGADDYNEEVEYGSDDNGQGNGTNWSANLRHLNMPQPPKSADASLMEEEENRPKSKKEVYQEIISKNKYYKAERAKEKEENEKLVEQLDKDFESLVQSQAFSALTQPDKMNALKSLVNPNYSKEPKKEATLSGNSKQEEPDLYDSLVSQMTLEMRARPSDRTKTLEEIAEEEKERLEQLEEERQNRMLATDDAGDEDDDSEDVGGSSANISMHVSGDDLGDSFTIDTSTEKKKGWVDDILKRNAADDSENEDSECSDDSGDSQDDEGGTEEDEEGDEESETLKDWEQSDDDNAAADVGEEDESEEEAGIVGERLLKKLRKKNDTGLKAEKMTKKEPSTSELGKKTGGSKQPSYQGLVDLPFKIDAPKSMDEMIELYKNRSNEDIIEAIRRICVCNAIPLAAENRRKMQVFYGLLLQYFATLANQKPLNFGLLNLLVKPLMEISAQIPYFSAICARERILRTRAKLCEDLKDQEKSCWPSLKTLFLLRLWSMIFPCSDFRHAVMTPAILLMCEYLMRCPVLSVRDAAVGSFLCSIVLLVIKQSQKFCPEALIFLKALLLAAMKKDPRSSENSQKFHYLLEFKTPEPLLCIQGHVEEIKPLDFLEIMNLPEDSPFFSTNSFRASVIVSMVETVRGFVNINGEVKAFPEIFSPISKLLVSVADQQNMPDLLQEKLRDVAELIVKKVEEHHKVRQPLQMRKQKPVPIKLLNPKFEENFVKGRNYDPDRARAEKKKLLKIHKKEAKGAARELRKDNQFLQEVKEKEKHRLEEERAEKYGKALAFLQEQEHAAKSGQLGKRGKRKR